MLAGQQFQFLSGIGRDALGVEKLDDLAVHLEAPEAASLHDAFQRAPLFHQPDEPLRDRAARFRLGICGYLETLKGGRNALLQRDPFGHARGGVFQNVSDIDGRFQQRSGMSLGARDVLRASARMKLEFGLAPGEEVPDVLFQEKADRRVNLLLCDVSVADQQLANF